MRCKNERKEQYLQYHSGPVYTFKIVQEQKNFTDASAHCKSEYEGFLAMSTNFEDWKDQSSRLLVWIISHLFSLNSFFLSQAFTATQVEVCCYQKTRSFLIKCKICLWVDIREKVIKKTNILNYFKTTDKKLSYN